MMRILLILVFAALAVPALTLTALTADPEIDPGLYEYVTAENLDYYVRMEERHRIDGTNEEKIQFKKYLGKKVCFCDELSIFWDELEDWSSEKEATDKKTRGYLDEYSNQEFLKSRREEDKYYKFETYYHRCLVPKTLKDSVAYLRYVNRIKNERRLLMIWGAVEKVPVYGKIDDEYGAVTEGGNKTEQVFVKCDKIARPRERFFKEWKKK